MFTLATRPTTTRATRVPTASRRRSTAVALTMRASTTPNALALGDTPRRVALQRRRMTTTTAAAPRGVVAATEVEAEKKEAVCYLRGVRMSASKIRRVLDVIRGKSYEECLIMLEFMPYRSCEPILNALFSCASNAKNNMGMNKAKLYVSECYADGGATMKRFRPRAQGRPFSIRKRTASITLKMAERED